MAGIYIHIPFCKSRCIYCGFYSTTLLHLCQRYVDALCGEMKIRSGGNSATSRVDTVYLGGGTPSQLSPSQLRQLFASLYILYKVSEDAEVTIEANPDDVTEEFATLLSLLPVNRVSMGVQTFDDERLRFLHRRHNAGQVPIAVKRLRDAGIRNISIDLMYGFPGETPGDWQCDIDHALALDVEHLSAYCLMYEEGTLLYEKKEKGQYQPVDEELERLMYETLKDRLTAAGFEHYEISNFARPGYRSRHNSSYWTDVPYIGLGAAAHSYDGRGRQWNVADIRQYIKGIESGQPCFEREESDADTRYNDRVMLSLRTCEGLDLELLGEDERKYCVALAQQFINGGLLESDGRHLRLTRQGLFVSDMVMSELMRVS